MGYHSCEASMLRMILAYAMHTHTCIDRNPCGDCLHLLGPKTLTECVNDTQHKKVKMIPFRSLSRITLCLSSQQMATVTKTAEDEYLVTDAGAARWLFAR